MGKREQPVREIFPSPIPLRYFGSPHPLPDPRIAFRSFIPYLDETYFQDGFHQEEDAISGDGDSHRAGAGIKVRGGNQVGIYMTTWGKNIRQSE